MTDQERMAPADREDEDADASPAPGKTQERVEDRPNVGTTKPEAYPGGDRAAGA